MRLPTESDGSTYGGEHLKCCNCKKADPFWTTGSVLRFVTPGSSRKTWCPACKCSMQILLSPNSGLVLVSGVGKSYTLPTGQAKMLAFNGLIPLVEDPKPN